MTSQELVGKTWKIVHFNRTKIRDRNYSCVSSEGSPGELCRGKEHLYWIVYLPWFTLAPAHQLLDRGVGVIFDFIEY